MLSSSPKAVIALFCVSSVSVWQPGGSWELVSTIVSMDLLLDIILQ